jgi:hypothetical protein
MAIYTSIQTTFILNQKYFTRSSPPQGFKTQKNKIQEIEFDIA